jgi:transposase
MFSHLFLRHLLFIFQTWPRYFDVAICTRLSRVSLGKHGAWWNSCSLSQQLKPFKSDRVVSKQETSIASVNFSSRFHGAKSNNVTWWWMWFPLSTLGASPRLQASILLSRFAKRTSNYRTKFIPETMQVQLIMNSTVFLRGVRCNVLAEVLSYKMEGLGFETEWDELICLQFS